MGEDSAFFRKSLQQQIFHLAPQDLPAISKDFQKTEPIIRELVEQYGALHIYSIGLFVVMRRLQNPEFELDVEGLDETDIAIGEKIAGFLEYSNPESRFAGEIFFEQESCPINNLSAVISSCCQCLPCPSSEIG
eukprot:CAMPEP_0113674626 /NCGR_PEP_ID=MMETSP0038_2-20120614/7532_1 /TAXON_ID=2898 /ORGANISM="Cryptomonas paramecium" /LENGTH=133 /DNA_ID=CAMNT_0000591245 /DNA_START=516 /DNA_END=913 /DNA_ORIENTATION=- /assembly_acc=CAM_ASM_000170